MIPSWLVAFVCLTCLGAVLVRFRMNYLYVPLMTAPFWAWLALVYTANWFGWLHFDLLSVFTLAVRPGWFGLAVTSLWSYLVVIWGVRDLRKQIQMTQGRPPHVAG